MRVMANESNDVGRIKIRFYLPVAVDGGATTCFSKETDRMCRHVRAHSFGQHHVCALFLDENGMAPLRDVDGWLTRRPECLAAEKEATEAEDASSTEAATLDAAREHIRREDRRLGRYDR